MDHVALPTKIKNWMDIIKECLASDPKRAMTYCDKLEEYADETRSDYLKGFVLYHRGFFYYLSAELETSMNYLSDALNRLIAAESWEMVAKTYNALGNISDFQGDTSLAIDCYMKGLILSREHGILLAVHDISSNIANIYISLNDPHSAVELLLDCVDLLERCPSVSLPSRSIVCANICSCYIELGELKEASTYLERLKALLVEDNAVSGMGVISCLILESALCHRLGEIDRRDEAIRKLHETEFNSINIFDALNELCQHAALLLEIDKIDEFLSLVGRIDSLVNGPAVELQVLELRLKYYKKTGDAENLARTALAHYEASKLREAEHKRIVGHNIQARMNLEEEAARRKEVEISNLMLKQKSERDALTGMNNRYKLNEMAELAFHRAYLNGTPLTVEILDIDCYKEFNDTYGHQAGDDCLIQIANAIRSMEAYNGVHTARYGGDEFVIIYEEYPKQDVEKMARRLHETIRRMNIPHKNSKVSDRVTISQGLFHKIPSGGNKTWDFLYGADMALYGVKNRTKNAYYIGTTFNEVRAYSKGSDN